LRTPATRNAARRWSTRATAAATTRSRSAITTKSSVSGNTIAIKSEGSVMPPHFFTARKCSVVAAGSR
jgi:hypothetical protein